MKAGHIGGVFLNIQPKSEILLFNSFEITRMKRFIVQDDKKNCWKGSEWARSC